MTLTITGQPATKKNSGRILKRGRKRFLAKSEAAEKWEARAIRQLRKERGNGPPGVLPTIPPERAPFNLAAIVYVDGSGQPGDLLNYLAAISDALERAFVVENDRQIVRLDGCELRLDRHCPRVEIELTSLADAPMKQTLMFDGEEHELQV